MRGAPVSPRRYYEGVNNLFLLLAVVAGAGVTVQAIVNARLGAAFQTAVGIAHL